MSRKVRRLKLLTGSKSRNTYIYDVWEPSGITGPHSTITSFGGGNWYGKLATWIPEELRNSPLTGIERRNLFDDHLDKIHDECQRLIHATFPETKAENTDTQRRWWMDNGQLEFITEEELPNETRDVVETDDSGQ